MGGSRGFETLLKCTAPIFWFFALLTATSLFVLRFRDADRPRPFAVAALSVGAGDFLRHLRLHGLQRRHVRRKVRVRGCGLLLLGLPAHLIAGRRTGDVLASRRLCESLFSGGVTAAAVRRGREARGCLSWEDYR